MTEKATKSDYIEQSINEAHEKASGVNDAAVNHIKAMLGDYAGVDLKKSEIKSIAMALIEVQTAVAKKGNEK